MFSIQKTSVLALGALLSFTPAIKGAFDAADAAKKAAFGAGAAFITYSILYAPNEVPSKMVDDYKKRVPGAQKAHEVIHTASDYVLRNAGKIGASAAVVAVLAKKLGITTDQVINELAKRANVFGSLAERVG
jgi:hypothetical protein